MLRISFSLVEGNAWMMRVHASLARVVWRVAKTRWPVSAAVRAASMVAASRISPTAMMSGSSLRDSMTPSAKLGVSSPISLWWTRALSEEMTYSTGSSRVTIWQGRLATAVRRMCASVVLLPLPEGPVMRTRPCSRAESLSKKALSGSAGSAESSGRTRIAAAGFPPLL